MSYQSVSVFRELAKGKRVPADGQYAVGYSS
jgi:hypothetical protein